MVFGEFGEYQRFKRRIAFSDQATFKLNGTINHYNCTYYACENPHITVWCTLSLSGIICLFLFEGNVNNDAYFNLLQKSVIPCIIIINDFHYENLYFQQGGPIYIIIYALRIILMKFCQENG